MGKVLRGIFIILMVAPSCASLASEEDFSGAVSSSIGKLVYLHDELTSYKNGGDNPFGVAKVYVLFEDEYTNRIKKLPVSYRVDFFLSSMWHLGFSGSYLTQFEALIMKDCGDEFKRRLALFIEKEEKLNRNKYRYQIAKMIYSDLVRYKK